MIRPSMKRPLRVAALAVTVVAALAVPAGTAAAAPQSPAHAQVAAPAKPHSQPAGMPDLGANVIVFNPSMPQSEIQSTVDAIAAKQVGNQFGSERYALLFAPGTYGSAAKPLSFQVGYYTQVSGLGNQPGDVVINGSINVYNQCFPTTDPSASDCTALVNFWRSMSNLTINVTGGTGCRTNTEFWAVSQAAPMRRVAVNGGTTLMDYCTAGPFYASGGYIADSKFSANIVNGSQQQFLVRNSNIGGWTNGVWNQVFSGVVGAPAQSFGQPDANPYTTLPTSPVTQEIPFLALNSLGNLQVDVPQLQRNSSGTSWTTAHRAVSIHDFFIAGPATSAHDINRALSKGSNLILTPGVYSLDETIRVKRADTIVLGIGFPTLVPNNGIVAMSISNVSGVKLSGVIFDAGLVNSPVLLQVGEGKARGTARAGSPTLIQDVFFRIGGAIAGKATTSLVVNSSEVILDDIWAWRADHGEGAGWNTNTADTGVVVNGDNVTAYGLFVEHYQKTEVIWNGNGGRTVFFQNEMPYDPPSQQAWQASSTFKGYPAFAVSPGVKTFQGYGMGSYSYFNQGVDIHASTAFQVPVTRGVALHDVLTVFLNGSGGIDSVVNGTGAPVSAAFPAKPRNVISYP